MTPRFYFAFRSPYSRIALARMKPFADKVKFIPFTGPPEGTPFSDPTANPAKLAYYQEDVLRLAIRFGLPIKPPRRFDVPWDIPNRAFLAADAAGHGFAFAAALSEARWGAGENIALKSVLSETAEAIGWSGEAARAAISDPDTEKALSDVRALIEEDKVFGVPFMLSDKGKYWGQDRLDMFLEDMGWAT